MGAAKNGGSGGRASKRAAMSASVVEDTPVRIPDAKNLVTIVQKFFQNHVQGILVLA